MALSITHSAMAIDLLAAMHPRDVAIMVTVIVVIVITPIFVLIAGLMQQQRTQALNGTCGDKGPPLPGGSRIRRYRATAGVVPPEIAALGQPTQVHEYQSIGREVSNMIGGLFGQPKAPPPGDKPTYVSYDDVLVVLIRNVYTVIPWDEITEFRHPLGFGISTGEKFPANADYKDYGTLYEKLQAITDEINLPRALETIASGGEVVFRPFHPLSDWEAWATWLGNPLDSDLLGPLTITSQSITYQGRTLLWKEVGSLEQVNYRRNGMALYSALKIGRRGGLLSFWRLNLNSIPNSSILLALCQRLAPRDVLVPA